MTYSGLDFGTSNSTTGIVKDNSIKMVPLDHGNEVLRSTIFLDFEESMIHFGDDAVTNYMDGVHGRLMTAIKSVLGSSLMDEKTIVFGEFVPFSNILGYFIKHMKDKAEEYAECDIESVVLGRPVRFNDRNDSIDQRSEDTLKKIAMNQGFKHVEFQYEPIAAAMAYESEANKEEIALIIDIGGGTSDFTIIQTKPDSKYSTENILATSGIHIGGTDFDHLLSYHHVMPHLGLGSSIRVSNGSDIEAPTSIFHTLSTWHEINSLYGKESLSSLKSTFAFSNRADLINRLYKLIENKEGHYLLEKIENKKKELSINMETVLPLGFIEDNFEILLTRKQLESLILPKVNMIKNKLDELVKTAMIKHSDIDIIYFTGGTTQIKSIQDVIINIFENATIVKGDAFSSVGFGLTLDASKKFR